MTRIYLALAGAIALASAAANAQTPVHKHYQEHETFDSRSPSGAIAPRLQNVGKHTFPVTTKSEQAQRFISQGLNLTYGFNHAEAGRAFAEAARLDPNAAMAYWGQALVLGPNINAPMAPEEEPKALTHLRKAQSLKDKVSQRERDYIDALALRFTGKPEDRAAADQAYAGAMRVLHETYPDDLDAATLYAEAVMDLRPWNYWTRDGRPYEQTHDIIDALDGVLAKNPEHPGALHYWIHLWEASNTPEKAEAAADRLLPLAPAAGHLVHMPGHIFQRVGRYGDAMKANQMAILADEDYITQCRAQGLYPLGYYPHNVHFLWFAASMAGQSKIAIDAANKTAQAVPPAALKELPILQTFTLTPDYALVRFGKWDEILALPAPRVDSMFTRGVRHYARGMAFIRKKDFESAKKEIAGVRQIANDPKLIETPSSMSLNLADSVLRVAVEVLDGELAAAQGNYDTAIAHLDRAVRYHDNLIYTEPDDWHAPVRHALGAVLLDAGRPAEAEAVYWEDLRRNPKNGWALFGLNKALQAQNKVEQAKLVEADFKKAWADADVTLTASRF
ncbi:MAG TPA: tetratricopeptide repeat protein [Steroidobacter sp.]|uniref:tetratricopeptide repeat protein n=1 Tax=Steroidobacter sp. TaxID=1978227 RepID=UPI002ED99541